MAVAYFSATYYNTRRLLSIRDFMMHGTQAVLRKTHHQKRNLLL